MLTIDADMVAHGKLTVLGTVRLEGRYDGAIVCTRLEIGTDGYLHGDGCAEEIVVAGQVVGKIRARLVHLEAGGIIEGELVHERLRMDEAATLVGDSRRMASIDMPADYVSLCDRSRRAEDDFRDLEATSRVRRAEQARAEHTQFAALRERFPAPGALDTVRSKLSAAIRSATQPVTEGNRAADHDERTRRPARARPGV